MKHLDINKNKRSQDYWMILERLTDSQFNKHKQTKNTSNYVLMVSHIKTITKDKKTIELCNQFINEYRIGNLRLLEAV